MAQRIDEIHELEQDWQDALREVIAEHPVSVQQINNSILPDGRLMQTAQTSSPNNVIMFPSPNVVFTGNV